MTDRLHLPQRYRRILEGLLREYVSEAEVWAYGSRITGESHEGSDLDLVVRGPGLEPLGEGFFSLLEAIENSNIPILVQAHDWARLPESFHGEIKRDYVVLQNGTNSQKQNKSQESSEVTLGDIAEIVMGYSPPGESVTEDDGVALLNGPTEFGPYHPTPVQFTIDARRMAHRGDILFCVRGSTTGRMNWADQEYAIGRGIAAIRHSEEIALQPFVRGVIELALPSLLAGSTGSTFPNVSRAEIGGIHIPDLAIAEQRAIAHVLGSLDDKIELNRRRNETLEEIARALFKSWFVDFDPVRAKAALNLHAASELHADRPNTPRDEGSDGEVSWGWTIERARAYLDKMDSSIAALFPDRFVESELGDIPEGWEVKALGECISVARGLSYKGSGLSSDGIPMHNLNSIYEGGGFKEDGIKHYNGDYRKRHLAVSGDVLVANTEQGHNRLLIGFAAIIPQRFGGRSLFSHHLYRIRPDGDSGLSPDFICQLLNTPGMHGIVSGYATGTTVNMLPLDSLKIPSIVVPPAHLLKTFSVLAQSARSKQEQCIDESRTLANHRDEQLPKLVTGRVQID